MTRPVNGAESTFEAFVCATMPQLLAMGTQLAGSPDEGRDLVQDALIRLAGAWSRVDLDDNPVGYARTIIVRLHRNRLRAARRELTAWRRVSVTDDRRRQAPEEDWDPDLTDALRALSGKQRTVVVLVHAWGYSIDEVATDLGCRPNTVKTHLARGLATLREQFSASPSAGGQHARH